MAEFKSRWGLWLPLALGLGDLGWVFSALAPPPTANAASSVGLINSAVWIYLHLPAAMLAGSLFEGSSLALGALGILQMSVLGWGLGCLLDRKRGS